MKVISPPARTAHGRRRNRRPGSPTPAEVRGRAGADLVRTPEGVGRSGRRSSTPSAAWQAAPFGEAGRGPRLVEHPNCSPSQLAEAFGETANGGRRQWTQQSPGFATRSSRRFAALRSPEGARQLRVRAGDVAAIVILGHPGKRRGLLLQHRRCPRPKGRSPLPLLIALRHLNRGGKTLGTCSWKSCAPPGSDAEVGPWKAAARRGKRLASTGSTR